MEVGMHEAKTHLSKLVERAEAGEDVVITRHGTPAARLVAVAPRKGLAGVRGVWRGRVSMGEDFDDADALPQEFRESFGL
jgi:prevent-host-death family protein